MDKAFEVAAHWTHAASLIVSICEDEEVKPISRVRLPPLRIPLMELQFGTITIGVFWRHNNFPWKTFVFCCTLCNLPTSYVMTWINASTFPWCFENTITSSLHLLLPFHVDSCPHTSPQTKRFSANDKVKRSQQSSTGASNSPTLTEQWPGVSRHHKYFLDANFQFIHILTYLLFIHCNMLLIYGIFIS